MKRFVITLFLFVFGCASDTGTIARSSTAIGELAHSSHGRFKGIHRSATSDAPNLPYIAVESEAGMDEQLSIIQEVTKVIHALPGVRDLSPWWAQLLTYMLILGSIVAVLVFMWRLGLDRLIRGWFGLVTPRATAEATLAADLVSECDNDSLLQAIEKRRLSDRDFDRAFRRQAPLIPHRKKKEKNHANAIRKR